MIAGIDFSTKAVDVVLLDEDTDAATWHRFPLTGADAFERARDVRNVVPARFSGFWDEVIAVGIEDPRGYGAGSLYRIQGAILPRLPGEILVHPLIPSSWRKTVGLKGNASKDDIVDRVPLDVLRSGCANATVDIPQDAFDAYCIALATRTLVEKIDVAA